MLLMQPLFVRQFVLRGLVFHIHSLLFIELSEEEEGKRNRNKKKLERYIYTRKCQEHPNPIKLINFISPFRKQEEWKIAATFRPNKLTRSTNK